MNKFASDFRWSLFFGQPDGHGLRVSIELKPKLSLPKFLGV